MRRLRSLLGMLLVASSAAAACASPSPTPTEGPTDAPAVAARPAIECGGLAAADCPAATSAVVAVLAGRNGSIVRIELGRGVWCPTPGLLFANTSCPGGSLPPPSGGQWIGHAQVTFSDSAAQAYVNVARNGAAVRGVVIALATPPPATPAPT